MKKINIKNKSSLLAIILIVLVLGYIVVQMYAVTHIELQTQTATLTTVYDHYDTKALFVRDEHIIAGNSGAITVPAVSDGAKVNAGGNVAYTFSSTEAANSYSRYNELAEELAYYENLESQTMGQAADIEKINSNISKNVDDYIRAAYKNNNIDVAADALNSSIIQRKKVIGESVDISTVTQSIRQEMQSNSSNSKADGYIKSDVSGVFFNYTDGYENSVDYTKVADMTIDDVKSKLDSLSKVPDEKSESSLGKLVTDYNWYMIMVVPAEQVTDIDNNSTVTIVLKNDDSTELNMNVVTGAEPAVNEKETVLVLTSNIINPDLASLRVEDVEIRYKSYKGIKMPMEAVHFDENGKKGVYALVSSQIRFRSAEVIYSEDDWVLLSYHMDEKGTIRLYDQIILRGKDLEDGRVYA